MSPRADLDHRPGRHGAVSQRRLDAVVVLGAGPLADAIAASFGGIEVARLHRWSAASLLGPGRTERDRILASIERSGASGTGAARSVCLVNAIGTTWGHSERFRDATNARFPEWLIGEVMATPPDGTTLSLVHLGSASEYGRPSPVGPLSERAPVAPEGAYGESKWAGSSVVLEARDAGVDAVVARVFNPIGPGMDPSSPVTQFLDAVGALPPEGGEVELWWPDTIRDFVLHGDIGRAVAALGAIADAPPVVNVCSGVGVRFSHIVAALAARRGVPVSIRSLDRPGIEAIVGDGSLLTRLTGIRPEMSRELIARHAAVEPPAGASSVEIDPDLGDAT